MSDITVGAITFGPPIRGGSGWIRPWYQAPEPTEAQLRPEIEQLKLQKFRLIAAAELVMDRGCLTYRNALRKTIEEIKQNK